jgi:hypothetical protein
MARFEYFLGRFAQEADQDRTRRALSDGLFTFLLRPYHYRENPKILQKKGKKTGKNLGRFAQEVDQSGPRMDLGRTR